MPVGLEFTLLETFFNSMLEVMTIFHITSPSSMMLVVLPTRWIALVGRGSRQGQEAFALDIIENGLPRVYEWSNTLSVLLVRGRWGLRYLGFGCGTVHYVLRLPLLVGALGI